eukprot:gene18395-20249_t
MADESTGSLEFTAFCWALIIINSLSVLLNAMFTKMLIASRNSSLRMSSSNRILLSLSISDVLVSCFGVALGLMLITGQPLVVYKIAGSVPLFGSMSISITSLAVLTIDRLMAIKLNLAYRNEAYLTKVTKAIYVSWVFSLAITVAQVLIYVYTNSNMELKVRGAVLSAFFISTVVILSAANFVLVLNIKRHNVVLRKTELETMKTSIGKIQPKNVVLPELTVVRPLAKSCDLNDPPLEMSKQQDTTNQNLRLQNRPKKGMLSNSEIPVHDKDNQDLQDKEMSEFRVEISTTPQSFSNTKNNSTVVTLQENTASERQKVRLAA